MSKRAAGAVRRMLNFAVDAEGEPVALTLQTLMQTGFMAGGKGSGKTTALKRLFEAAYDAGAQCGALATLGKWWSLRISASGKRRGLANVYVFGGKYGDVQVTRESGRAIARAVHSKRIHYIIDVEQMRKDDRQVLMADFLEELMLLRKRDDTKESAVLFLDEMQNIAPQKGRGENAERLKEVTCDFARECRNFGMGMWGSAQRVANVEKDYIGLVDALIVMRITWSGDRDVVKKWVDEKGASRDEDDFTWVKKLRRLEKGQAYLHVPEQDIFQRVQVLMIHTFDATKTAVVGEKIAKVGQLSKLDVKRLGSELATVVAESEANDPVVLRAKVAELEKALRTRVEKGIADAAMKVAKPVKPNKQSERAIKRALRRLERHTKAFAKLFERFEKTVHLVDRERDRMAQAQQVVSTELNNTRAALGLKVPPHVNAPPLSELAKIAQAKFDAKTGRVKTIQESLEQRADETRTEWKNRTFGVHYSNADVKATYNVMKSGRQASTPDLANVPRDAQTRIVKMDAPEGLKVGAKVTFETEKVSIVGKQKVMLAVLANGSLTKRELAGAVAQARGGTFDAYVSRLKAWGYIVGSGDMLTLTQQGIDYVNANGGSLSMTADAILTRNKSFIVGKMNAMVAFVRDAGPCTKKQLLEGVGQAEGGTADAYVSRLVAREIFQKVGDYVRWSPMMQRGRA